MDRVSAIYFQREFTRWIHRQGFRDQHWVTYLIIFRFHAYLLIRSNSHIRRLTISDNTNIRTRSLIGVESFDDPMVQKGLIKAS